MQTAPSAGKHLTTRLIFSLAQATVQQQKGSNSSWTMPQVLSGTNYDINKLNELDIQVKEEHLRLPLIYLLVEISKHLIAQKAGCKKEDILSMFILAKANFFQHIHMFGDTYSITRRWLHDFFDSPNQTHGLLALGMDHPALPGISAQAREGIEQGIIGRHQSRNLISSYFHVIWPALTTPPRGDQAVPGRQSPVHTHESQAGSSSGSSS